MGVAFVSGGASGIGAAIVRGLAERGWSVVIGDIDEPGGLQLAGEVGGEFVRLDVADPDAWRSVPRVDVAFLNAGVMSGASPATPDTWSDSVWTRIRGVNVDGVLYGLRSVLDPMLAVGRGSVLITSSQSGVSPLPVDPLYSATKHFVIGLVRSTAAQLAGTGVRINALCPGATDTPLISTDKRAQLRLMSAKVVAGAAVDIALNGHGSGEAWLVPNEQFAPINWAFRDVPADLRPGATPATTGKTVG